MWPCKKIRERNARTGPDLKRALEFRGKERRGTCPHHLSAGSRSRLVQHAHDAIFSRTLDGEITSWNSAAEKLYGYTAEEIVGKNVSLLIPANQAAETESILEQARAGETIEPFEPVRVRKGGSFCDVYLTISPIKDSAASSLERRRSGDIPSKTLDRNCEDARRRAWIIAGGVATTSNLMVESGQRHLAADSIPPSIDQPASNVWRRRKGLPSDTPVAAYAARATFSQNLDISTWSCRSAGDHTSIPRPCKCAWSWPDLPPVLATIK